MNRWILLGCCIGLGAMPVAQAEEGTALLRKAQRYFSPLPESMPGAERDTPALVGLGKQLFSDTRLSINDTQSCSSCHRIEQGQAGIDHLPTSIGARGEVGNRNAPTVWNAGWQSSQFWDGRAADLVEQARGAHHKPHRDGHAR